MDYGTVFFFFLRRGLFRSRPVILVGCCLTRRATSCSVPGTSTLMYRDPTTNGGMQNGSSVGICTRCIHVFARLVPINSHAQSVLINKFYASELSWKFIKSALLVGEEEMR